MADDNTISTESAGELVAPGFSQPAAEQKPLPGPGPKPNPTSTPPEKPSSVPRKRGRPKGSRNKPRSDAPRAKQLNSSEVPIRAGGWVIINGRWVLADRSDD